MSKTYRRIGRVHALTTRTTRAIHINAYVIGINFNRNVIIGQYRYHFYRCKRGMPTLFFVGWRNAD